MEFVNRILNVAEKSKPVTIVPTLPCSTQDRIQLYLDHLLQHYWFKLTRHQKYKLVIYAGLVATSIYIITPTIFPPSLEKMLSKQRPDRYTTGFINMTVDCFANSTLQSLLLLPGLNDYLNELCNTIYNNTEIRSSFTLPQAPLHEALIDILSNLQKIIYKSKTISVWDFLNVLEKIFKSKISRNQHDAHELLQLILETLMQENSQLYKYAIKSGLSKQVDIPQFPFKSLFLNQLHCTVCGGDSNLNFNQMMILTLAVPQESSTILPNLIAKNENELIEGYSCLRCKINAILNLETQVRTLNDDDLEKLKQVQSNNSLLINEDLSNDLDSIIKNYKPSNGFDIKTIKTTIVKKTNIVKAPKILPIHLSRSIFATTQNLRNSCQVIFPNELILETDDELAKKFEQIEDEKILSSFDKQDLEPIKEEEFITKPNILKDLDEKEENAFYEDVGQTSDIDEDNNSIGEEDEEFVDEELPEDDDEDDNNIKISSPVFGKGLDDIPSTYSTTTTSLTQQNIKKSSDKKLSSPKIPIELIDPSFPSKPKDITPVLTKHKYILKSMIRHAGTHQAGHYECYRHKPEFYKLDSDEYEIAFPFLTNSLPLNNDEDDYKSQAGSESAISDSQATTDMDSPSISRSRLGSISRISRSNSILLQENAIDESQQPQSVSLSRSSSRKKPRRFSRRLSSLLNSSNPIESLTLSTDEMRLNSSNLSNKNNKNKKKKKRLGSFVKYPYWRISDSKITEVKMDDVLNDNKAVYMLFYERVD